jgi:hypothetical protein
MSTDGEPSIPRLRRDPSPSSAGGRKVLIGVAVFFLLLVGFVLTLVFTIGVHNNGVKFPPSPNLSTTPATVAVPPFFAIDANTGAAAYVTSGVTYRSKREHQRAVAMGVAPGGKAAYFAAPISGCRTVINVMRAGRAITIKPVAVVDGHVIADPMAVSADGTKLAFAETPPSRNRATCGTTAFTYSFDLIARHLSVIEKVPADLPVSLVWVPKVGVASLVAGRVTAQRVGCLACSPVYTGVVRSPLGALLMWKGKLAVVSGGVLREVESTTLGPALATGFPDGVVAASIDQTGKKLLLWGGLQTVEDPGHISYRTTYLWSGGHSTYVPGEWIDPAW